MAETVVCSSCQAKTPFGKKFCSECGQPLENVQWHTDTANEEGFVVNGVWQRPATEFVRRVRFDEMDSAWGRRSLSIPRGSVAVILVDGQVEEILPPGHQLAVGWLDRLSSVFSDKLKRSEFFLIDTRPLPIPFPMRARSNDGSSLSDHQVLVELSIQAEDKGSLSQFLDRFGRDGTVTQRSMHDALKSYVEPLLKPQLSAWTDGIGDLDSAAQSLNAALSSGPLASSGMRSTVRILTTSTSASIDLLLGVAPAPATKLCVNATCGKEMPSTQKFCKSCGEQQPIKALGACTACGLQFKPGKKFCTGCGAAVKVDSPETTNLFSADGQQLELDLVVLVSGDQASQARDRVGPVVASAASKQLKRFKFEHLATANGFADLEKALRGDVEAAIRSLGLSVSEVTILDIRSKGADWLLKGRAELEQAKNEVLLGREWLQVEEQNLDVKALGFDMALRNQRAERDHRFHQREDELAERKRQQDLVQGHADLDVTEAERNATRDLGVDAAERRRSRALAGEDHQDARDDRARQQEAQQQQDGYRRENTTAEQTHQQRTERTAAQHEMAIEKEVATHDADLSRQAMHLQSGRNRLATDDQAYVTRTQGAADVDVARAKQDLELETEARRMAMRSEQQQQQVAMLENIRAMDRAEEQQNLDHELNMRQQLKGMSAEQMLAMQAGGDEAIAAAFGEKFKADAEGKEELNAMQNEMLEQRLADRDASQEQMMQMAQMMQQASAQQLAVLGNVTATAIGGQKESAAATQAAHAASAEASANMAAKAMGSMADVAAASAAGAGKPAKPPRKPSRPQAGKKSSGTAAKTSVQPCGSCGAAMRVDDKFCGDCGWKPGS